MCVAFKTKNFKIPNSIIGLLRLKFSPLFTQNISNPVNAGVDVDLKGCL